MHILGLDIGSNSVGSAWVNVKTGQVEVAAEELGESVNSWLVRTLGSQASERGRRRSRRVTGTIET